MALLSWTRPGRRAVLACSAAGVTLWPDIVRWADEARARVGRIRNVLEIGCGTGQTLSALESVGFRVYGIDSSTPRVNLARQIIRGPVLALAVERLDQSSFGTSFDLVIGHHVLEHLFDPNELFGAVRKVLRPGGLLFLAVPNLSRSSLMSVFHAVAHPQAFTAESLLLIVHKHGFVVDRLAAGHDLQVLARLGREGFAVDAGCEVPSGSISHARLERQLQDLLPSSCRRYEVDCSYRRRVEQSRCVDPGCTNPDHRPSEAVDRSASRDTAVVEVLGPRVGFPIRIVNPCCDAGPVWVK
jgi:SAM-dependent methyltransferase